MDRDFDREARCGGGISSYMLGLTGVGELPQRLILSQIGRVRVYAPNGEAWEIDLEGLAVVVDRKGLDRWLNNRAEKLGATLTQKNLGSVLEALPFDFLVGADGVNSTVRKWLTLPRLSLEDLHFGIQAEVEWPEYPQDRIDIYFGHRLAPQGYCWTFPAGGRTVRIGLGVPLHLRLNPGNLLSRFVDWLGAPAYKSFISKLIPTAPPMDSCVFGNVALVGDAANHCDPMTGGGIANALICGNLLGQALARGDLARYDRMWKRTVGRRNRVRYRLKRLLTRFSDEEYNRLIRILRRFRPKTVSIGKELILALAHVFLSDPGLLFKPSVLP